MANDNIPRGLVPINWPGCNSIHYYRVQTGNDIFLGQPVDFDSTGYVTNALSTTSAGQQMYLGVAVGFAGPLRKGLATDDPYLDASDLTSLATGLESGDRWVAVADDPNQEFVIQADTGGTLATLAAVGEAGILIYRATSGNTDTGWANLEFDASSNATGTNNCVQLLRLHDVVNTDGSENTAGANYTKWVVKFLNHRRTGITVGGPV